ncbi:MAG: molybdenum cofactor guanylyltransferase [Dyadobacter sp.]|uniref:molybdenum cofactor guanylyltransferase n=1 Tax=Dyadobacter sp. TaxID=1914288 RepID=UPI003265B45D
MALYGLVICGGSSARMGTDKSALVYYDKPQHDHVHDLLALFCEKVIISCNKEQYISLKTSNEKIADLAEYSGHGPISGLLTAFHAFPEHHFLVAGCDYPFLNKKELELFLTKTKRDSAAAAFYNQDDKYEPLLAWYSKEAGPLLKQHFNQNEFSLQHFLKKHNAERYVPQSEKVVTSVDTPEEFRRVKAILANENNK